MAGDLHRRREPRRPSVVAIEREFTEWVRGLDFGEGWDRYRIARRAEEIEERRRLFELAVEAEPTFCSSLYFLSSAELELGSHEEALAHAEQAVMVFPEYSSAMLGAIRAAAALERWDVVEYWAIFLGRFASRYLPRVADAITQARTWRAENPDAPRYNANPLPTGRIPE